MNKKYLYSFAITVLLSVTNLLQAQDGLFKEILQSLKKEYPQAVWDQKLLVVSIWEINDLNSRDMNKTLNKTTNTYRVAKLKGGLKGMIWVCVAASGETAEVNITLQKDGVTSCISFPLRQISGFDLPIGANRVYNSAGELIYQNVPTDKFFESIHSLITR